MSIVSHRVVGIRLNDEHVAKIALIVAMILWGTAYVAAKFALRDLGPMTAAFARFGLATGLTLPLLFLVRGWQPIRREYVPALIGSALFQTTLYFALQYTGLRYTTAANTALIVNTRPLVIVLLAQAFLHERLTRQKWFGLFIAFVGVVVLVGGPSADLPTEHLFGDFLIVLNALSAGIGIICAKHVLSYYKPFTALVYQIILGTLGLLPLALIETGGQMPVGNTSSWVAVIFMAILCTAISQMLLNVGLMKMDASKAAPFYFLVPVLNAVVAYYFFDEPITWALIVGGALILLGNYWASSQGSPRGVDRGN